MRDNKLVRLLAYVTGSVNQKLLLQNEYLAVENRILRAHLPARARLADPERSTLAEIGKRLGRKRLAEVACVAKPDTIRGWYRRLCAQKFGGSRHRRYPGRPSVEPKLEELIVADRAPRLELTLSKGKRRGTNRACPFVGRHRHGYPDIHCTGRCPPIRHKHPKSLTHSAATD